MKKTTLLILILVYAILNIAAQDTIFVDINLKTINKNKIDITINYPIDSPTNYCFPKSIKGTYDTQNSGSHCSDFKSVTDSVFVKTDINTVAIKPTNSFNYKRETTYRYFSPTETVVIKDSVYVLNWHSIVGYFKGKTKLPYCINVRKPAGFKSYSTIPANNINDTLVSFRADSYDQLIDCPVFILKNGVKVKEFTTNNKNIRIVSYSDCEINPLDSIFDAVKTSYSDLLKITNYPNKDYTFFIYSSRNKAAYSALEHKNNSVNSCMIRRGFGNDILMGMMIHEFLHACYVPLVIQSDILENFDYQNPKCDQHLWLYEGVTEYLSMKLAATFGMSSENDFIMELYKKVYYERISKRNFVRLRNVSLTKYSEDVFSWYGKRNFGTVYSRGALVAMLLDFEIIKNSGGKKDLHTVIKQLQNKYSNKSFNHNTLFDEINAIVNIDNVIKKHIKGRRNIKLDELINPIGYSIFIEKEKAKSSYLKIRYYDYVNTKFGKGIKVRNSIINKRLKTKEVIVIAVNGKKNPQIEDLQKKDEINITLSIIVGDSVQDYKIKKKSYSFTRRKPIISEDSNLMYLNIEPYFWEKI